MPSSALYRRFVRRAQVGGLLADHLVRGEPYLALDALVLDPSDDAALRRLTESFSSIFHKAGQAVAGNVPSLEELGFPWVAAELLRDELPRVPLVGRFDFVRDTAGHWWLLEFNADTPSGVREAIAVEGALCALRSDARDLLRPSLGLREALRSAFVRELRDIRPGEALGLVTSAGELEDLAQMAFTRGVLVEPLAALGVPVVLGDIDNLRATRAGLVLGECRVGAIYRYVPFETTFGTPPFAALYDAVASRKVRLLNGLYGLLLQHKGLLAWIWTHRDDSCFTPAEQAAIREHLPETVGIREFAQAREDSLTLTLSQRGWPPDNRHPTPDTFPPDPSSYVVKQVFGREGEEVFFGEEVDAAEWARFRREGTYVVQRRVAIEAIDAVVPTALGARVQTGYATVGSFAVAGAWAGYYTRFGGKIITSRAKWLATLARRAP
jgi:glutathionylspermidine synthase